MKLKGILLLTVKPPVGHFESFKYTTSLKVLWLLSKSRADKKLSYIFVSNSRASLFKCICCSWKQSVKWVICICLMEVAWHNISRSFWLIVIMFPPVCWKGGLCCCSIACDQLCGEPALLTIDFSQTKHLQRQWDWMPCLEKQKNEKKKKEKKAFSVNIKLFIQTNYFLSGTTSY